MPHDPRDLIDRLFDEILFPRIQAVFDEIANPHPRPPKSARIPKRSKVGRPPRVHKAPHPPPNRDRDRDRDRDRAQKVITYYEIFEISPHASVEVIAAAHRALVKKYHPDVAGAGVSGEAKIKVINAVWEVLRDPAKRKAYDRSIGLGVGRA